MTASALQSPRREVAGNQGSRRTSRATLLAFLVPAVAIFALFTVYPVLRTIFNSAQTLGPTGKATFVGLHNFEEILFRDKIFWKAVGNTAIFTICGTIADVVGGLLLALCLFAGAPMSRLLRVIWFTPVLMSYVVVGIIWTWLYDYDWGLINQMLRWIGLGAFEQSWLGDPSTALWAVLVTHLWKWLGFNMIICLAALSALPKEVLGAALGRAFRLLALGSTVGLLLGLLASRVLAYIVYEATPRDPLVLAGVVLSMAFLGLLATWIPARRALSVDPAVLLREQ